MTANKRSVESLYEELRRIIDNGSESMTHEDAVWDLKELMKLNERPYKPQPVTQEAVYETIIQWDEGGGKRSRRELARRIVALYATQPQPDTKVNFEAIPKQISEPEQEPVAWLYRDSWGTMKLSQIMPPPIGAFPVYTTPQPNTIANSEAIPEQISDHSPDCALLQIPARDCDCDAQHTKKYVTEPVARVAGYYAGRCVIEPLNRAMLMPDGMALYTTPPRREWVGLTQQDIDIAFDDTQEGGGFDDFARAIEAKLKEKNT